MCVCVCVGGGGACGCVCARGWVGQGGGACLLVSPCSYLRVFVRACVSLRCVCVCVSFVEDVLRNRLRDLHRCHRTIASIRSLLHAAGMGVPGGQVAWSLFDNTLAEGWAHHARCSAGVHFEQQTPQNMVVELGGAIAEGGAPQLMYTVLTRKPAKCGWVCV